MIKTLGVIVLAAHLIDAQLTDGPTDVTTYYSGIDASATDDVLKVCTIFTCSEHDKIYLL